MSYSIRELSASEFPPLLKEIPDAPKKLFCAGSLPTEGNKILCIVGARKYSSYGREVLEMLVEGLRGYPITIVSGLALGTDSLAHKAALKNKIQTIAVPGSGIDPKIIYPSSHARLAEEIVSSGGGLISEFENDFRATLWSFPKRNRIMAGMSDAVLVTEAELKSGTLITSRLATDYNREVMTIPGSIFSRSSEGPHMLIRLGATPITKSEDIIRAMGFEFDTRLNGKAVGQVSHDLSPDELKVVEMLKEPMSRDDLIRALGMPAGEINMILSAMEIKGIINESMGEIRLC